MVVVDWGGGGVGGKSKCTCGCDDQVQLFHVTCCCLKSAVSSGTRKAGGEKGKGWKGGSHFSV